MISEITENLENKRNSLFQKKKTNSGLYYPMIQFLHPVIFYFFSLTPGANALPIKIGLDLGHPERAHRATTPLGRSMRVDSAFF